ncbi:sulfur carrier protein ThiS [Calderihabitans maritimus]|uniref:Thiamine biosynthesis protein ThiS n=1 Tax=Calderihabitans maritimus TaxID=1246530 RepID=A0A1Z5HWF8_9FIRM|nr:sulfur carrier protein ThiS [Calderihabitans maritimus]GAW93748.1 thiamine biosynthesis protein ThiS [Calderihabitans maritimus]
MEILLNGERHNLPEGRTISELLAELELSPDVVSVSLNGTVLKKEEFDGTVLQNGDAVEIMLFMGGGI